MNFTPIESFNSENIIVNLDGTDYILPKVSISTGGVDADIYGEANESGPLFATYPCAIAITYGTYQFFVPQEGTYEVKISIAAIKTNVSECFSKAVEKVVGSPLKYVADDPSGHGGVIENAISGTTVDGGYVQNGNHATGKFSHAEGYSSSATGQYSHVEGSFSNAEGENAHAEGYGTNARGENAHAEGDSTAADGAASHAEGQTSIARGDYSHAQGYTTQANGYAQTVIGKYNTPQGTANSTISSDYAFIIGNGINNNSLSNAFAIKWDGTFVFANGTEITPAQFASLLALLN